MKFKNLIVSSWNAKIDNQLDSVFMAEYSKPQNISYLNENKNKVKYHWNDKIKAENDCNYLKNLKNKLLPEIAKKLNDINNTDLSIKTWDLIIGNWLNSFLIVSYDRFYMIKKTKEKHKNLFTYYSPLDESSYIPFNTLEAINNFEDEKWNYIFINQIIEDFKSIKVIKNKNHRPNIVCKKKVKFYFKSIFKFIFFKFLNFLLSKYIKNEKTFIFYDTNFSVKNFILLVLNLKVSPLFEPNFFIEKKIDSNMNLRKWNLKIEKEDKKYEKILKKLIPFWMPNIFLESFNQIKIDSNLMNLKKIPDYIFTVHGHIYEDAFKIWAGKCIDKGSKLIIASHLGGVPPKFHMALDFEAEIADYYLVSGDQEKVCSKSFKIGQFWNGLKYGSYDPKGKILLVSTVNSRFPRDLGSFIIGEQIIFSLKDQIVFYKNLPFEIRKRFFVRIYQFNRGWDQKKYWYKNFKYIKFSNERLKFSKEVLSSRLIVCSYFGKTFVEVLSANIPTIIFWDSKYEKIAEFCADDFNKLRSVGIFHDNPRDASDHLILIWDDIESWWYSKSVQNVREDFCKKYGQINPNQEKEIAEVINNI